MRHPPPTLLPLVLSGCVEIGFSGIGDGEPPAERVVIEERFVQEPLPGVDLLFVIDATLSMEQELAALGDEVEALLDTLDAAGVHWQIGVVGVDMLGDQGGVLLGTPWVLTPTTDDVIGRLEARLQPDPFPSPSEAGLAAAAAALAMAAPGGANAGFRRPGAGLQVVFVSDDDDGSDALHDDPVGAFLDQLQTERAGGGWARAAALVGDVPGGCSSSRGSARAGTRYVEAAEATGGVVASICDAAFDEVLAALGADSVVLPDTFALEGLPISDSPQVTVDGATADGWSYEVDPPRIRFEAPPAAGAVVVVRYTVENAG